MIGSKGPPSHWPLHPQQQKTAPQASVPTEPIDGPQPAMPMGASSKHFPPIKSEFRTKYACATFFGFHKSLRKITVTAFCTQSHGRWMIIQMMFRICKWQIYIFRCQPFMFQDANLLFPPSFPCLFFSKLHSHRRLLDFGMALMPPVLETSKIPRCPKCGTNLRMCWK